MSSRFALVAGVLLSALTALPLSAQQSTGSALRDTGSVMRDTTGVKKTTAPAASSDSALVELGRAIAALAVSVQTVVAETAKNPEVRRAAVQTASTAVTLAQKTLEENSGEIERLLAEASRRLADTAVDLKTPSKAPRTP
jgi:hypothetical protein